MKFDRWKHQNQLQIEPRLLKFALRSSSGAILSRKREQYRVKSVQERVKRPFGGSKAKKIHRIAEGIPHMVGVGGYAEAGGGVRGGKLPEFGGSDPSLERFAPVVNDGCGGLSSLRATAAPLWDSDVGIGRLRNVSGDQFSP